MYDTTAVSMDILCCLSLQLWLCLAALCVIDKEHAEALSSGQWLGQDGKPKSKVEKKI